MEDAMFYGIMWWCDILNEWKHYYRLGFTDRDVARGVCRGLKAMGCKCYVYCPLPILEPLCSELVA
jgi:hypothetical protein